MLLPLQGGDGGRTTIPRAPLRSALGYEQVALSGRTELHPWRAIINLSSDPFSCHPRPVFPPIQSSPILSNPLQSKKMRYEK